MTAVLQPNRIVLRGKTYGITLAGFLAASLVAQAATPTGMAISQQVSIASYQHYLEDLLYTSLGDDRGFGPQHDFARDNIAATLASFGLDVTLEPFSYNGSTYYNVVAIQHGRAARCWERTGSPPARSPPNRRR